MIYINIIIYVATVAIDNNFTDKPLTTNELLVLSAVMIMLCIEAAVSELKNSTK